MPTALSWLPAHMKRTPNPVRASMIKFPEPHALDSCYTPQAHATCHRLWFLWIITSQGLLYQQFSYWNILALGGPYCVIPSPTSSLCPSVTFSMEPTHIPACDPCPPWALLSFFMLIYSFFPPTGLTTFWRCICSVICVFSASLF